MIGINIWLKVQCVRELIVESHSQGRQILTLWVGGQPDRTIQSVSIWRPVNETQQSTLFHITPLMVQPYDIMWSLCDQQVVIFVGLTKMKMFQSNIKINHVQNDMNVSIIILPINKRECNTLYIKFFSWTIRDIGRWISNNILFDNVSLVLNGMASTQEQTNYRLQ